jgi:hypothetical protein
MQVNLRSGLGRRALRHEPLGIDLDGRIYYTLNPRPIDADGRAPMGWASGLLVWGMGVPLKEGAEDIPVVMERWSHFGKSSTVKQLAKWVEWRYRCAVEAMRPVKSSSKATPTKTPMKATTSPSAQSSARPKTIQSTLNSSKGSALTPARRHAFEVVIPISSRKATSSTSPDVLEAGSDSEISELSPPPETSEDLLHLACPVNYRPGMETVEQDGKELTQRLHEVAEWLEVLEWKGLGEI